MADYILSVEYGISPFVSMPLGMFLSGLAATIIGYGTFRLHGAYFSIATIAFAESLRSAIQYFSDFTKGTAGIYLTYRGENLWALTFSSDRPFYYIMLILLVLSLLFTYFFTKSKIGYYLNCIRDDEIAAKSLGIETFRVKLRAFQISAMMMSVAGCFYASFLTYISPLSTCSLDLSIKIGVVAIIGGIGTFWGPVLGAFIIVPLIEMAGILLGKFGSGNVLYGLMLILIVMFRPAGVISLFNQLASKFSRNNKQQAVPAAMKEERT
ncbi:MAG: branched-chain amino acid ABC transporter permease [Acetivibrionales bacterium]